MNRNVKIGNHRHVDIRRGGTIDHMNKYNHGPYQKNGGFLGNHKKEDMSNIPIEGMSGSGIKSLIVDAVDNARHGVNKVLKPLKYRL